MCLKNYGFRDTVQEAVTNLSQRKRKAGRQSGYLRRPYKQLKKEEKQKARERSIQLNADFQRTARRDKKAFFNKQCIKLEENSRRGKTIDISSEKLEISRESFTPKVGTIKDRNGRDLVILKGIKKRWKEYTELYKKDPNELDYYNGVVSHPEPNTLESKVRWALGSTAVNKASGCNAIPVELFKTLKDDAIKVLHSIHQQIWRTQQWPQVW